MIKVDRASSIPSLGSLFGVRGPKQVFRDMRFMLTSMLHTKRFGLGLSSAGLLRPDLSLAAYAGLVPKGGFCPIYNLFDQIGGGKGYQNRVTRKRSRDFRSGRLTYDEHDGTDFVLPPGLPITASAPGVLAAVRDWWLRGGLTAVVDHGRGVVTQYSHLSEVTVDVGTPLKRGDALGISGVSGVEMTMICPWVPPHVHFMVWHRGRPVDPFMPPEPSAGAVGWAKGRMPVASNGPLPDDPAPPSLDEIETSPGSIRQMVEKCLDDSIRAEINGASHDACRAAILEDSLHHQRYAWPEGLDPRGLRGAESEGPRVMLTLPVPASIYRGARFADTWWTVPRQ